MKKTLAILIQLALLISTASCSGKGSSSESAPTTETSSAAETSSEAETEKETETVSEAHGPKYEQYASMTPEQIVGTLTLEQKASQMVQPGTLIVVEHSKANDFSHLPQFTQQRVYGKVHFSFFEVKDN